MCEDMRMTAKISQADSGIAKVDDALMLWPRPTAVAGGGIEMLGE